MGIMIYIMIIILFLVLLLWTWNSVKGFENSNSKITYIILGIIVNLLITLIIFNISKSNVNYSNLEVMRKIKQMILLIFTPVNGLITLPCIAKIIVKRKNGEESNKLTIFLIVICIIAIIFECFYFSNIQNGILQIMRLS